MATQPSTASLGLERPQTTAGEYNKLIFAISQAISKLQTVTLVRVEAVTNSGGVSPVGFVDVLPLVHQIDGLGNPTPHGLVPNLPYVRLQGGPDAIILDPKVGDIGICLFASRDISKVKVAKKPSPPGSFRQYSFCDGLYLGGVLNGTPSQFVRFHAGGIAITTPGTVAITSASLTHNGVNIGATHVHGGVQTGGGNTGVPV